MTARFDYASHVIAVGQNEVGSTAMFKTKSIICTSKGSSMVEVVRWLLNPGYAGVADKIAWQYQVAQFGAANYRRRIQFRSTGAWNDLPLSSSTDSAMKMGCYESSSVKLPLEFRFRVNSTQATYNILNYGTSQQSDNNIWIRLLGTVTT